jgi:hypothetical protein
VVGGVVGAGAARQVVIDATALTNPVAIVGAAGRLAAMAVAVTDLVRPWWPFYRVLIEGRLVRGSGVRRRAPAGGRCAAWRARRQGRTWLAPYG